MKRRIVHLVMTNRQLVDLMRAADDLAHVGQVMFGRASQFDEEARTFARALALLKAIIKESSQ